MKKIISIVITVTLLAPFVPQAKAETPTEKVIIVFKDKVDEELVENVNGDVEQVSRNIPVLTGEIPAAAVDRSEEHTSELQSRENLVCRLLLEKKNKTQKIS